MALPVVAQRDPSQSGSRRESCCALARRGYIATSYATSQTSTPAVLALLPTVVNCPSRGRVYPPFTTRRFSPSTYGSAPDGRRPQVAQVVGVNSEVEVRLCDCAASADSLHLACQPKLASRCKQAKAGALRLAALAQDAPFDSRGHVACHERASWMEASESNGAEAGI